MTPARFVPIL